MANIYLRQMNELKVDVEQYSKLLDAPIFIVRRLVKGETLSEDMGLNEFIRNNIFKKYNELEKNKVETQSKVVALKIDVDKKQNDLLEWYKNEFDKNVLMDKYECYTEQQLYRKIPMATKPRYTNSKHFSTNEIISISTFNRLMNKKSISLEFLMSLLEQLKKYYDSEIKENVVNEDFTENKKTRLENWWENFDLKSWLYENDIPITTFTKEAHIGHVSYYNIVDKTHQTSLSNIKKIKEFVDNFKKKDNNEIEKMEEIEIIDEDIIETPCETNKNVVISNEIEKLDTFIEKEEKCENECLNDVLKNILKDRLTDEEKKLIEIFGGKIC